MLSNKVLLASGGITDTKFLSSGDVLLGPNGIFSTVISVETPMVDVFKISTKSGPSFYVCKDNIISNTENNDSRYCEVSNFCDRGDSYLKKYKIKLTRANFAEFENDYALPIDPYIFGIILTSSTSSNGGFRFSAPKDSYMREIIKTNLLPNLGMKICRDMGDTIPNSNSFYVANLLNEKYPKREPNRLIKILKELHLNDVKVVDRYIPDCYKYAGIEERKKLLAAIIDCSAYGDRFGFQITCTSIKFAQDIEFIARSLGLTSNHRESVKNGKTYQIVHMSGDMHFLPLHHKNKNVGQDRRFKPFTIEALGKQQFIKINTSDEYLLQDFTIIK